MGKILFLSDVHGNMPAARALEAQLDRIQPDDIWFLGDAVGKGPEGDKAVDWVRRICRHYVKGNWDDGICKSYRTNAFPNDRFYWEQLGEERIEWLESLPLEDEVLVSGQWFRLIHGRPVDRLYQAYDDFATMMLGFDSKVSDRQYNGYICADSHMPYVRACGRGYVVNTGSVGNSLGVPRVHAAVLEGDIGSDVLSPVDIRILSIPYDNAAAVAAADEYPDLPRADCWKREVMTGIYSR